MCAESGHAFRESGLALQGAAAIARGTIRLLLEMGSSPVLEVTLDNGRRADLLAVDRRGSLLIVEVKSSVADFQSDRKWPDYLPHCDSFYFSVAPDFPAALIPESCGLMVADAYGGVIVRPALEQRLSPARRRAVTLRLARTAAERLARQILPLAP